MFSCMCNQIFFYTWNMTLPEEGDLPTVKNFYEHEKTENSPPDWDLSQLIGLPDNNILIIGSFHNPYIFLYINKTKKYLKISILPKYYYSRSQLNDHKAIDISLFHQYNSKTYQNNDKTHFLVYQKSFLHLNWLHSQITNVLFFINVKHLWYGGIRDERVIKYPLDCTLGEYNSKNKEIKYKKCHQNFKFYCDDASECILFGSKYNLLFILGGVKFPYYFLYNLSLNKSLPPDKNVNFSPRYCHNTIFIKFKTVYNPDTSSYMKIFVFS